MKNAGHKARSVIDSGRFTFIVSLFIASCLQAETFFVPVGGDIEKAINFASSGDIIQFEEGAYTPYSSVNPQGKELTFIGAVSESGIPLTIFDGEGNYPVIKIDSQETSNTRFLNLVIINGPTTYVGNVDVGASSNPTFENCIFENNQNSAVVGGWGSPTFQSCIFRNNSGDRGGAFRAENSDASFIDCEFSLNTSTTRGGAVSIDVTSTLVTPRFENCDFIGNKCTDGGSDFGGGALFLSGGAGSVIVQCDFVANTSSSKGGAVSLFGQSSGDERVLFENCNFNGNISGAYDCGGAVYNDARKVEFNKSTFNDNYAFAGGAVHERGEDTKYIECTFTSNSAINGGNGGAIWLQAELNDDSRVQFLGCEMRLNNAQNGGAIYSEGSAFVDDCVLELNTAAVHGGGVFNYTSAIYTTGSVIRNNMAKLGGGLYTVSGSPSFESTIICGNTPNQIVGNWENRGGNDLASVCESCPDTDADGVCDADDQCPGLPDIDTDSDGTVDCLDQCPDDPEKIEPGNCGCGLVDTTVFGDIDCDGDFDQDDYVAMGGLLGIQDCPGDLNNDGVVDGADLTIILSSWGVCDG